MRMAHFFIDHPRFAAVINIFIALIGLALMFLFVRVLPAISIFEMREVVHHTAKEPTHALGD